MAQMYYLNVDFNKDDNLSGTIGADPFDDTLENLIAADRDTWGGRVNESCDKTVPVIVTNQTLSNVTVTTGGSSTVETPVAFCCNTPDF